MTHAPDARLMDSIRALSTPLEPRPTGVAARISPLPHIRAVLFDVYGTLLISESPRDQVADDPALDAALRPALNAAGLDRVGIPEQFRASDRLHQRIAQAAKRKTGAAFPAIDIRIAWRNLLAELLAVSPKKLDPVTVERVSIEIECRIHPVWPMPGLSKTLTTLRSAGSRLGILADTQFFTPLVFEALLGQSVEQAGFDPKCCLYSHEVEMAKPSPRIYEEAMIVLENEYAILCDEVLYVGSDLREDIPAARATGFRTALFAGDARSLRLDDHSLDDHDRGAPDRVLTDLRQLAKVLPQLQTRDRTAQLNLEADIDGDD